MIMNMSLLPMTRLPGRGFLRCAALLAVWATAPLVSATVLLPGAGVWKYLDTGTNLDVAWRAANYDDRFWKSGPGPFGYGEGDEQTVVSYGPAATNKFVTTYFRSSFLLTNATAFNALTLSTYHDNGVVVYLNNTEVL